MNIAGNRIEQQNEGHRTNYTIPSLTTLSYATWAIRQVK